jgi:hypothetical protein
LIVTDDREQAGHLLAGLDFPGAVQDIRGAVKFLLSKGCKKVTNKIIWILMKMILDICYICNNIYGSFELNV